MLAFPIVLVQLFGLLTDVCIITKLGEVCIERYAVIRQVMQFVSKTVKVVLDVLELFVCASVLVAQVSPALFMMCMELPDGLKLDLMSKSLRTEMTESTYVLC